MYADVTVDEYRSYLESLDHESEIVYTRTREVIPESIEIPVSQTEVYLKYGIIYKLPERHRLSLIGDTTCKLLCNKGSKVDRLTSKNVIELVNFSGKDTFSIRTWDVKITRFKLLSYPDKVKLFLGSGREDWMFTDSYRDVKVPPFHRAKVTDCGLKIVKV